jgi:uncharacterized membrane protein
VHEALLFGSAFLASSVEMVEALTIVLAVGVTRGWKSALVGVALAFLALAIIVGVFGVSLVKFVPIDALRITVGLLLLIFGLQWLRKAVLRAAGLKAKHNEAEIFREEMEELRAEAPIDPSRIDWTGFVVSFKGVFLEGLEVAFIVITFGANKDSSIGLAATAAFAAFVVVVAMGAVVHQPLTRVPENAIKFTVGLMLASFGTFWGGEGIGVEWTLKEPMILILAGFYWLVAYGLIAALQRRNQRLVVVAAAGEGAGS